MRPSNSYLRARLEVIEDLLKQDLSDEQLILLRNGMFPDGYPEKKLIKKKLAQKSFSNARLSLEEISRFDSWFALHPEKMTGKQVVITSKQFPITVKASKQQVIDTISSGDFEFELRLKQKQAKSKLKLLSL